MHPGSNFPIPPFESLFNTEAQEQQARAAWARFQQMVVDLAQAEMDREAIAASELTAAEEQSSRESDDKLEEVKNSAIKKAEENEQNIAEEVLNTHNQAGCSNQQTIIMLQDKIGIGPTEEKDTITDDILYCPVKLNGHNYNLITLKKHFAIAVAEHPDADLYLDPYGNPVSSDDIENILEHDSISLMDIASYYNKEGNDVFRLSDNIEIDTATCVFWLTALKMQPPSPKSTLSM